MKKLNLDSPATKRDLEKLLTKDEFKRALGKLATKEELKKLGRGLNKRVAGVEKRLEGTEERLDERIDGVEKALRAEIKITVQETKEEIKEEFGQQLAKTESRILEAIDDFAKEAETAQEERLVGSHQQAEDRKRLENHERRITTLEEQKFTAPA